MWKPHKINKKLRLDPGAPALDSPEIITGSGHKAYKSSRFLGKLSKILTLGGRNRWVMPLVIVVCTAGIGTYFLLFSHAADNWWGNWESLGGSIAAAPAAASWGPNNLQTFVRGSDNHVYERGWNGSSWVGYYPLGGTTYYAPAAASLQPGNMNVFAVGTDNQVYISSWTANGWTRWQPLGGKTYSAPTAVAMDGSLYVFVRGTDNGIWEKSYSSATGAWSGWSSTGFYTTDSVSAVSLGPNNMNVFYRGPDNSL